MHLIPSLHETNRLGSTDHAGATMLQFFQHYVIVKGSADRHCCLKALAEQSLSHAWCNSAAYTLHSMQRHQTVTVLLTCAFAFLFDPCFALQKLNSLHNALQTWMQYVKVHGPAPCTHTLQLASVSSSAHLRFFSMQFHMMMSSRHNRLV